ncbi:GapS4b family protein [Gluconobacter cerinus]
MKSPIDTDSIILFGSDLRVLLNSDHISYGEIDCILKEKGIYIGRNDKCNTVPILSSTLLTPDNFSTLIESSIDRESQSKIKISNLELNSKDSDWISPLRNGLFDDSSWLLSGIDNVSFNSSPNLCIENENEASISYKITRTDYSKNWLERELVFCGTVNISKKDGFIKLEFSANHSSKETNNINNNIINNISKLLKHSNIVTSENPDQIRFNSFDNEERIRFFKRLTAGLPNNISVGDVDNIEINVDKNAPPLPNDPQISWMKDAVKKMKIDGEKMNDVFLISDEQYYKYYHIQKIDLQFKYQKAANSGKFKVSFFFNATGRSDHSYLNAELTFLLSNITYENKVNETSKKNIRLFLDECMAKIIDEKYQTICKERK